MSDSSSGSDSRGKDNPPRTRKKKSRGNKIDLATFLKCKEPKEEAIKSPNEEASPSSKCGPRTAAAEIAVVAASTAGPSAATSASSTRTVSGIATSVAVEEAVITASVPTSGATSSVTPSTTVRLVADISASQIKKTAPKLTEVVKAASKNAPAPNAVIMRPSLKKTQPSPGPNAPKTSGVVLGTSYAQQVSGSSNKSSSFIEILGTSMTPRPPPSDAGKPRPKSDVDLQKRFDERWQDERYGMYFEHIRGSAQSTYLEAICSVIPQEHLFSFGLVGKGMVEVYTATLESATKLMLTGIEVGGRHLSPYPVSNKPIRVAFSRVPMNAKHDDLLNFLRKFGKVHGKVRQIPLKIGDKGFGRGVYSTSREAYVTLNQDITLPPGFFLTIDGIRNWIEVITEAKCHACQQVGHFIAECPKRRRKVAEAASKEGAASVETSQGASSPGAAPGLEGHSANKMPEVPHQATAKIAEVSGTLVRERPASTDEESLGASKPKKRRTKRKLNKSDQEVMPPPAPPTEKPSSKGELSDSDEEPRAPKPQVVRSEDTTGCGSESGVMTVDEDECSLLNEGPLQSGYESCGSSFSVGSRFEVVDELSGISKEKMRSLLDNLNYRKSSEKIWSILKSELEDPEQILPQLKLLQKEARAKGKYNQVSRCERLYSKISSIIEERKLESTLRP